MSLTNPNTPVSQQDLKDLYEQKILPYIGGAFGLVATGIDSANLYSTTERVIGQWIDGKPLYAKTIQATIPTAQGTPTDVSIGASVDTVVDVKTMFMTGNGGFIQSPVINGALSGSVRLSVYNNSYTVASLQNKFRLEQLSGTAVMGGSSCYVTLQYTKTTDSAVESYGTDTTYSTDEHVVGSWIDGSPVYQKVIKLGNFITFSVKGSWTNIADVSSLNASGLIYCYNLYDGDGSVRHAPVFYRVNNGYLQYFQKDNGIFTEYESNTFIIQYIKTS